MASVWCVTSPWGLPPLIPKISRRAVFAAIHGLAHPGVRAMSAWVVWRGMSSDIPKWVKECQAWTKGKVTKQPAVAIQPIAVPSWQVLSYPCGSGRAVTSGHRWQHISAHHHQQNHPVAGSGSLAQYGGQNLCRGCNLSLNNSLQCAQQHYYQ